MYTLENILSRDEKGVGKPLEEASFEDILDYIEYLKETQEIIQWLFMKGED